MVHCCAAYNCTERYKKGGVSFHSFPTSQTLREKWTKAMRRLNYKPSEYSKLCEKHFTSDCYETAPWSCRKRLKEGAVPTIFEFSPFKNTKYQKKSIQDNCQKRCLDEPDDETQEAAASENDYKTPIDRNNQQMVEMKSVKTKRIKKSLKSEETEEDASETPVETTEDLNLNDSHSSGMNRRVAKFPSDKLEVASKIMSDGCVSSLPAKRSRKKKTFFGDFISEDWTSKGKRKKGDKLKQIVDHVLELADTENEKPEAAEIMDDDLSKSLEGSGKNVDTSKHVVKEDNGVVQKGSPGVSSAKSDKYCSLEETGADADFVSETKNKHYKLKSLIQPRKVNAQMMIEDKTSPTVRACNLISTSRVRPGHCPIQKKCADFEIDLRNCLKQESLNKDQDSGIETSQKKAKKSVEILQNESLDFRDESSSNDDQLSDDSERQCDVEIDHAVSIMACKEMPSHRKRTAVNITGEFEGVNKETTKQVNNCNISIQSCSDIPVTPTSSQKLSSILKLNLEEEEATLEKCVLSSKDAKKGKNLKSKKTAYVDKDGPAGVRSQNYECMDMSSDEEETSGSNYLKRKCYIGDFKVEDLVSPESAAKCLKVAQNVIREKDKRIKYLKQRERRLMKKVEELESVIFHLVENKMNPEEASTVLIVLKDND